MTEIEFHTNVQDKLVYTCRLLRKVYRSGARAVVTAEPALLSELDALLWGFSATDFLPHCLVSAGGYRAVHSPVMLAETPAGCPTDSVLVNMGQGVPESFDRFNRFLEVVSAGEDRLAGRQRWKHYVEHGYTPVQRHDAANPKGDT
jgi:DNA polymerase-3 subunit chi